MNESMRAEAFCAALDRRLVNLKENPCLAQQIISAEKQLGKKAKKPVLTIAFALLLLCALLSGAVAAVLNAWGIVDFAGRGAHSFVPPAYEESIRKESRMMETALVMCTLQESYYDGKILRLTAQIVPKERVLLFGGDASPHDPEEVDGMTLAEAAMNYYDGCMADVGLYAGGDETHAYRQNEDGSVTVYLQSIFEDEAKSREVEIKLVYLPFLLSENENGEIAALADVAGRETAAVSMAFLAVPVKRYHATQPLPFPGAGVKITNIVFIVTPLEIRYALDFEITDMAAYHKQKDGLWFEFLQDGEMASDGLTDTGSIGRPDGQYDLPDAVGTIYRQTGSIGLDAMGESLSVCAYHAWDKTRYETMTFEIKEID